MRLNKGRPAGLGLMMLAVVLALLSSSVNTVWARPKEVLPQDNKIYDWTSLRKNNFFMAITNYGILGQSLSGDAYGFWPAPTVDVNGDLVAPAMNYIYGWGLWIGAQVMSTKPGKTRDTMCTIGYNANSGTGEFTAGAVIGGVPQMVTAADVKIFSSLDGDWPLKTTAGGDSVVSVVDTRAIYNDWNVLRHATGGIPLKVEVTQTTYQWNYPSNQDVIFCMFEVKNTGPDTLFDVYLAPMADNDIGNESGTAANDVCYFDASTNMAYQYQLTPTESQWTRDAGCIGFMFLESPKATKDYTFPDGYQIYKDSTIGLFAFKVFNINIDPMDNLSQYKELAGYDYQTGKFIRFDPKPAAGDQRFMESTGPIDMAPGATAKTIVAIMAANFDYAYLNINDTLAIASLRSKAKAAQLIYDSNWLLPGPPPAPALTITPGHRRVIIGWDNSAEDVNNPKNKNLAYYQKVTSDSTSLAKFDPNFLTNILQGYKLYKSEDGAIWNLVGQWDKDDNITVDTLGITVTGPEPLRGASVVTLSPLLYKSYEISPSWIPTSLPSPSTFPVIPAPALTQGSNSGLQYSYVDENLINGFTYYYAVTSYGVNWQSVLNAAKDSVISKTPLYFETTTSENVTPVVPRSEPNDYLASTAWVSENAGISYGRTLLLTPTVDLPREIKTAKYRQVWGPVTRGKQATDLTYTPKLSYTVLAENGDTLVPWTYPSMDYETYRDSIRWFKSIKFTPGNYLTIINQAGPVTKTSFRINQVLTPAAYTDTTWAMFGSPDLRWAFRSGNYEVRWFDHNPEIDGSLSRTDTLWAQVWHVVDSVKNIVVKVPYDSLVLNNWLNSSWNFGGTGTGLGRRYIVNVSNFYLKWMNICGIRLYFNNPKKTTLGVNMVWARKPANGDIWKIRTSGLSGPVEGEYQIINTSEYQFTASVVDLKKIAVVPNPYIVRNIWERTNDRNKLQFVNLPTKCTVKIYTLAGNLIKVLEHDDNGGQDGGTCWWDPMLTMNQQQIASGVYLYYVDAPGIGTHVGKFAVVR